MPDSNKDQPLQGGQGFPADNRDGTPGLIGKDDFTREYEIARLQKGRQVPLSGNYADLQRLGAEIAKGKTVEGVSTAPGVNPSDDTYVTPAQHDAAKGEWTVESERAGLIDAPVAADPPVNKDPDSIDPSSTQPTVASGSASSTPTPQAKNPPK